MLPPHEVCGALRFFLENRKIHRFSPPFTVPDGSPNSTNGPWTCAAEQVSWRAKNDVATTDEPQVGRGAPSFLLPQPPTRARDPKTSKWLPAGQPALFQPHTSGNRFWRHSDELRTYIDNVILCRERHVKYFIIEAKVQAQQSHQAQATTARNSMYQIRL